MSCKKKAAVTPALAYGLLFSHSQLAKACGPTGSDALTAPRTLSAEAAGRQQVQTSTSHPAGCRSLFHAESCPLNKPPQLRLEKQAVVASLSACG